MFTGIHKQSLNLKRGNISIILSVVLLLIVGSLTYYLGTQNKTQNIIVQNTNQLTPSPTDNKNDLEVVDESKSPNGLKVIKQIVNNSTNGNPWKYLIMTDIDGGNGSQLMGKRDTEEAWGNLGEGNWNKWGHYFFITLKKDTQEDIYIFKIDGQPFSDGKYYFLASEVGYPKLPLHSEPRWQGPTELVIIHKQDSISELYILNAESKLIKKGPAGS